MKRTLILLLLFPLITLLLSFPAFCADSPLKMGVLVCLSGPCSSWGTNALNGILLAVEEVNSAGGVQGGRIELEVEDSREAETGAPAVKGFLKLIQDSSVRYVIGPTWGTGAMPLVPELQRRPDIIIASPSAGVAAFNEASPNIFNTWPHDYISSQALARFALKQGWKKVALIAAQTPWDLDQCRVFQEELERRGGNVVARVEVNPGEGDLNAEALKVRASKPDAIFLTNWDAMPRLNRALRRQGYGGHILALQMDEKIVEASQGAAEGTIFTRYEDPSGAFVQAFRRRFGEAPGISADTAYDAVHAYVRAAQAAASFDATKVEKEMLRSDFEGASGRIRFDNNGGVVKEPRLWKVEAGKFVSLQQ